jgi:hypothetical protein
MRRALSLLICFILFVPTIQAAQKQNKNKNKNAEVVFHRDDQRVIREYYRNTNNLPPGLAKRGGNLPPGLQKQLRRNGKLPPGLENRLTGFPDDLDRRLPALPGTYRRGMIGDRAVIYDPTTNMIMDMINIFGRR